MLNQFNHKNQWFRYWGGGFFGSLRITGKDI